jgi:hypothetical protein
VAWKRTLSIKSLRLEAGVNVETVHEQNILLLESINYCQSKIK